MSSDIQTFPVSKYDAILSTLLCCYGFLISGELDAALLESRYNELANRWPFLRARWAYVCLHPACHHSQSSLYVCSIVGESANPQWEDQKYFEVDPHASAAEWTVEVSDDDLSTTLLKRQPTKEPSLCTNTYWQYLSNSSSGSPSSFGRGSKPFIAFKVVYFPKVQKTLLSITWAHVLGDMQTMRVIMENFVRTIDGQTAQIPQVITGNPLDAVPEPHKEAIPQNPNLYSCTPEEKADRFDSFLRGDGTYTKPFDLYLPGSLLKTLKSETNALLKEENGGFVSEADCILAWYHKFVASLLPYPEEKMSAIQMVNLRSRNPQYFKAGETHLCNSVHSAQIMFQDSLDHRLATKAEVDAIPFHHLAHQVRKSLLLRESDGSDPIVNAFVYALHSGDYFFFPPLPCANLHASNMLGFQFGNLSFNGALKEGSSGTGKVEGLYEWSPNPELIRGPVFRCHPLWKDEQGGVWCKLELPKKYLDHENVKKLLCQ